MNTENTNWQQSVTAVVIKDNKVLLARRNGATKMNISIVEGNQILKDWYIDFGFKPTYTEKYDFFPFTCGYMERMI